MITEKTIFDLLCRLDSGERSLGDLFKFSCVKLRSHEQICLLCNKDDLAVKTLTKMTIYTDKCICSGNIWCVSVILVCTLENIICQVTLVKNHLQILFDKVFALCKCTHLAKYSLPNIHCQRNIVLGNVA